MKNKLAWGIIGLLVISFIVIAITSQGGSSSGPANTDLSKYPVTQADHILGSQNAKVVIVEYGDFQCPACKAYAPLLEQAYNMYHGQIALVFRHFPLIEIHNHALAGAQAAEAAGLQGKFFDMYNLLYQNQDQWVAAGNPQTYFDQYAQSLGLDINKFNSDLASPAVENTIKNGRNEALALGLQGTPSLFVNGKLIALPQTGLEFQKEIDTALIAAGGIPSNATTTQQ